MVALDASASSNEYQLVSQKAGQVAIRVLSSVLHDPVLHGLMQGFHNNQFIMICHAMTEALHVSVDNRRQMMCVLIRTFCRP